jgi:hypothetical protein
MSISGGSQIDPLDRLVAIEAIKNVKARYWFHMDMKDWDGLRSVFTDDAIFDMRAERAFSLGESAADLPPVEDSIAAGDEAVTVGAEAIATFIRTVVESWKTVHHGHAPIIEVTEPDFGTAIWPLFDYIDDGRNALKGYGHYHEEYRRIDGRWLISRVLLTRIRADGDYPSAERLQQ